MSHANDPNPFAVSEAGAPAPTSPWPEAVGETDPKSLRGLVIALYVLLTISGVLMAASSASGLSRSSLIYDIAAGRSPGRDAIEAADMFVAIFSILGLLIFLPTAVTFIIWQYGYVHNSRVLGSQSSLRPGWAIGGWFIPFANFVLPAVQLFGASRASDRARTASPRGRGARVVVPWAIAIAVGANLSSLPSTVTIYPTTDPRKIAAVDFFAGIGYLILVVAAVLAIVMVRTLSRRQEDALAALATAAPYPPVTYGSPAPPMPPSVPPVPPAVLPTPPGRSVPPPA